MSVIGITFDSQTVTAANDAQQRWARSRLSRITKGCEITYSGLSINISGGYFETHGRQVRLVGTTSIILTEVSSGTTYGSLVFTVDLSQTNTEEEFNQGYFEVLTSNSGYPTLTQDDLDDNPTGKYQMPFADFTQTVDGITSFIDKRQTTGTVPVTLLANGWTSSGSAYTQSISYPGSNESFEPRILGILYPTNCSDATRKGIQSASSLIVKMVTGTNQITFTATDEPDTNITLGLGV